MESVHVREANGEVVVFLDRNMGDRLNALKEALKIIGREVLREQTITSSDVNRKTSSNVLPPCPKSDGFDAV